VSASAIEPTTDSTGEVSFTRDCVPYLVRPIRSQDRRALLEAFGHLSEESRYARFLRPVKHLTDKDVSYFTEVDHRNHEALVALAPSGELIGVARYIRVDQSESAEVAVTIVDEWQQRGVGSQLLRCLANRAREAGVKSFVGICLADNRRMLEVLTALGSHVSTQSVGDGVKEFEVVLPTHATEALTAALGAAARHSDLSQASDQTKEK
jgi:RimJ/RimL family protein N-acetyltransferase